MPGKARHGTPTLAELERNGARSWTLFGKGAGSRGFLGGGSLRESRWLRRRPPSAWRHRGDARRVATQPVKVAVARELIATATQPNIDDLNMRASSANARR